ncbi:hypothetical protein N665_1120s0003 [Sinapis alba]|nr:hypothetical protein N665_1120s0003 [Sinapis alba]
MFQLQGENYNLTGSLTPEEGDYAKFGKLYIINTENEVQNRSNALRGRFRMDPGKTSHMRIISRSDKDGRKYNTPTTSEVAVLIPGNFNLVMDKQDIVLQHKSGRLTRINEIHISYLELQYPLLFFYAEDGFKFERENESGVLLYSRRLIQQFIVDVYTTIESNKLRYLKLNQICLCPYNYNSIRKSFTGSRRYMKNMYLDAMIICRHFGLKTDDRPDIICRMFKMKLDSLMNDLTKKNILGKIGSSMYTVDFQKTGLPHANILLFMHPSSKFPKTKDIDNIILAEIPDKSSDHVLYNVVNDIMIHGPCGAPNMNSPCKKNGKRQRMIPKQLAENTIKSKCYVEKNSWKYDNRWVIPYNKKLSLRYRAHINVEWCNQIGYVKYLFKYINKGADHVTVVFKPPRSPVANSTVANQTVSNSESANSKIKKNEINDFFDCRYISTYEGLWRIFEFPIHYRSIIIPNYYTYSKSQKKFNRRKQDFSVGIINYYPFRQDIAYFIRRLLDDDQEYIDDLVRRSYDSSVGVVRDLFVLMLLSNSLIEKLYALVEIEKLMKKNGSSLSLYESMPQLPDNAKPSENVLILDELNYDSKEMQATHDRNILKMTDEQRKIYDEIIGAVVEKRGGMFLFMAAVRCRGDIVINTASSKNISLLLQGGKTAHYRFSIQFNHDDFSTYTLPHGSDKANLIKEASLIIWYEVPVMSKHCFECLDRSLMILWEIMIKKNFWWKGYCDFRHVFPVIIGACRGQILLAAMNSPSLWEYYKFLNLTKYMRLCSNNLTDAKAKDLKEFSEWILAVGDGRISEPNNGEALIDKTISHADYGDTDLLRGIKYPKFFQQRAILCPKDEDVNMINDHILYKLDGIYIICDNIDPSDRTSVNNETLSGDFLNIIKVSGLPNHSFMNGTGLQITQLMDHMVEARIITGEKLKVLIVDKDRKPQKKITNVVFKEVFNNFEN